MSVPSEIDGDVGNGIFGRRAQHGLPRNAEHFGFDRGDDPAFDFLGRHPRRLEDHLDLGLGDIGIGIDRQAEEGPGAQHRHGQRKPEHDEPVGQRKGDQLAQHCRAPSVALGQRLERRCAMDHDGIARLERAGHDDLPVGGTQPVDDAPDIAAWA
jgi:hypothetical protein